MQLQADQKPSKQMGALKDTIGEVRMFPKVNITWDTEKMSHNVNQDDQFSCALVPGTSGSQWASPCADWICSTLFRSVARVSIL